MQVNVDKKDDMKTSLGKLAGTKGRDMSEEFTVDLISSGRRFIRTVDGQGRISIKRYRLYVNASLSKQKIEIREFLTSLADRADAKNLDHPGLNLKVKFLGGASNALLDRVTDQLSCLATQFADDKLAAMRFVWEVTSDIGV